MYMSATDPKVDINSTKHFHPTRLGKEILSLDRISALGRPRGGLRILFQNAKS
jgi:hypothetical protein